MKQIWKYLLILTAGFTVSIACSKEDQNGNEILDPTETTTPVSGKQITITATLSDAVTKVSFDPAFNGSHKPTGMAHTWQTGDKLCVTDESNSSNSAVFDLIGGDGTKEGVFQGTIADAASYSIEVIPAGESFDTDNEQTQASDGDTSHLKYVASATGVTDLNNFTLNESSSIIGFVVKLPAGAAATIKEVEIETSTDDFDTSTKLNVTITTPGDTDNDGILKVYANVPASWGIPASSKMFLRFKAPDTSHTVYTRYQEFASAAAINPGEFNYLKLNCEHTDQYAGKDDAGTSAKPYLIADPYQLAAVNGLAAESSKTFFKMIDDVDMTGMAASYTPLNTGVSGYTKAVDFDGNHKTISNLAKHLFYVFKGSVKDLTLDAFSNKSRGILAEYIQGTGHTITNVDVTNGTVNYSSDRCGGLVGRINSGTAGTTTVTITDCDVVNTTVTSAGKTGVLIGSIEAEVVVGNCTVSATGSGSSSVTGSGDNVGGLIGLISTKTTVTDCAVSNTNVSGPGVVGGVIGYANAASNTISGCSYSGGTVTATARYCGGMLGSTGDYTATVSDCHVTDAAITTSSDRVGGFIGQIGRNGVTVKGCTVGTESDRVSVHSSISGANVTLGGFVGVSYGTVTKNGDVRSKAYTTITCNNSSTGTYVYIGGFVGYLENGTVEYSDADATMSGIKGHAVGGFAGTLTKEGPCKVDNCTSNATVSGNNYVAGFIGLAAAANHTISNNTSAGTVSGAATVAGFIGQAGQGTLTKNSTSCTVTASGANSGNFAGQLNGNVTVSKCFCTGDITGNGNVCGGFTGIASNGATINDCYSTSTLKGGTRKRGGIAGYVDAGTVSINRCYTTSNISNNFEMGGLVGYVSVETFTMTKCAAWNGKIVASSRASNNWSSAACVGVTYLTCTLTDNYRSPNMDSLIYWGTNSGCSLNLPNSFQHPDVSTTAPLTDPNGAAVTSSTMRPYQGKCDASKTLSELASTTLGWSSDVWDFSGPLPLLK